MTDNPSETGPDAEDAESVAPDAAAELAAAVAAAIGVDRWSAEHGTGKVYVERESWVAAATTIRDEFDLRFFSFLTAVDWSKQVAIGDPVGDPDTLTERYEVMCRLSSATDDGAVHLSTDLPKDDPRLDTLVAVYGGASWHEREAYEMFGIDFVGHPKLVKLYLPDAFEGHPLRKSYPLLSRDVKPWPGTVDVEDMPTTENPEATESAENGGAAE